MAVVTGSADGNFYLTRKSSRRNWFWIKNSSSGTGCVTLNVVCFPKDWVGKKVRFKVEIVEG